MESDGFTPVLAALATMQSNVNQTQKEQAHKYLEAFQKSARPSYILTNAYEGANYDVSQKRGLPPMPCLLRPRPFQRLNFSLQLP